MPLLLPLVILPLVVLVVAALVPVGLVTGESPDDGAAGWGGGDIPGENEMKLWPSTLSGK